jgi:peptidoglycan/xylan/chitin deacetylase (PgdA/CDA1 family)
MSKRPGSAAAILLYHQIGAPASDPFRQYVRADHFAGQMEVVARQRPVDLRGLGRQVRAGSVASGSVAVTFDDGYVSNLRLAKPALERAGVPATVFVTSGMTGSDRNFWWFELAQALESAPREAGELRVPCDGAERAWRPQADRREVLFELWAWLRRTGPDQVAAAVAATRRWAGLGPPGPASDDARCMTIPELQELVDGGLVEIGAHTRTHPMLSALDAGRQREEIAGSRADLESWLGRPAVSFAYPFGGRVSEYRAPAVRAVRTSGFEVAVAVGSRAVTSASPILELPRHVAPDLPADEFARWLADRLDPPLRRRRLLDTRPVRALRERVAPPGRL